MTRDEWIGIAAAVAIGIGVIEWSFISIEKLRIDWDWFQSVGLILICATAGLLGYWQPRHAWRWGFLSIAAIPVWILIRAGSLGPMGPIFVLGFMAFVIPPIVAAVIGAWLRRRRTSPRP